MSCCNKDGHCIYQFPQPIVQQTTVDNQGCVHFQYRKEEYHWVVLYLPSLLSYMNCHTHVDICSTVNVFIYLYKYLFKEPDQTRFTFQPSTDSPSEDPVNEFRDYINNQYLSSSEAVYQIFSFYITLNEPSVQCLAVHLENENLGQMQPPRGNPSMMSDLL
jgi:hypothetical protein